MTPIPGIIPGIIPGARSLSRRAYLPGAVPA